MKGKQSKDCQPSSLAKRESHTQVQSQMLLECSGTEEFVPFAGPAPSLRPLDEKSSVRKLQGGVRTHMVAFHSFQFISIHFNSFQGIQPVGTVLLWSGSTLGLGHSPCLWWPDMASLESDAHLAFIFHALRYCYILLHCHGNAMPDYLHGICTVHTVCTRIKH